MPVYLADGGSATSRSIVDIERGFFFKPDNGSGTVEHEAAVLQALGAEPSLRRHLPRYHGYDDAARVLALEYPPDAVDLGTYNHQRRRPPVTVAAAIGRLLALLHRLPLKLLPSTPWAPSLLAPHHPTPEFSRDASTATLDLIRIVQSTTGFGERLDALGATRSSVAPTHQNVTGNNILVRGKRPGITLIGWDLAGPGDPRWDIGSALAHYLTLWISSIPDSSLSAQRPLETVQPAIRACWDAYAAEMGMKGEAAQRFLDTTLPFAAVRLVWTALESARASHRPTAQQLLHLQVAHNILERPQEAVRQFLSEGSGRRPA